MFGNLMSTTKAQEGEDTKSAISSRDSSRDSGKGIFPRSRKLSKVEQESSIRALTEADPSTLRQLDRLRKNAILNLDVDRRELDKLAVLLRRKLNLSVHRRLVHSYPNCFRGSEAVSWLVTNNICTDPEDAKNLMRHLLYRRVILRVDHTKPIFNSVIQSVVPDFAKWRQKKQLQWYQDSARQYNLAALYTFNTGAFAQYRLVVQLIGAKGLRYIKHNHLTGRWDMKKIAPLANVTLGGATAMTSVEEKTGEPRWDETFVFDFDKDDKQHEEVWIKVFDFRELGESFAIGVCCIQTQEILRQCGIERNVPPPTNMYDAPSWISWHPLLPPATMSEPEQVRGGQIQVGFQVLTNVVDNPDETVHDECRPSSRNHHDAHIQAQDDIQICNRSQGAETPKTVLKYQHLDRRSSFEIEAKRPKSADDSKMVAHTGSTKSIRSQNFDCWAIAVSCMEIHNITDIPAGAVVWVELIARSPKKSLLKDITKKSGADESGLVIRKKSRSFLWPKDKRKMVPAGAVSIPIPADILKYTTVEFRVIRKGDISNTMVGKGRLPVPHLRKAEEEDDSDNSVTSEVTQLESGEEEQKDKENEKEDGQDLARSPTRPSMSITGSEDESSESKMAIPEVDDLPFQKKVLLSHQDAKIVVLRKQAAFKRNIKIKSGQIHCYAKLRPVYEDEDLDDGEAFGLDDLHENNGEIDIEEALKGVVVGPGETPKPITIPEPFANVYIDTTVNASVQRLAMMLLGSNSKFSAQFAKERKNTEMQVGPWQIPDTDDDAASTQDAEDASSEVASPASPTEIKSPNSPGVAGEDESPPLIDTLSSEEDVRASESMMSNKSQEGLKTSPSGASSSGSFGSEKISSVKDFAKSTMSILTPGKSRSKSKSVPFTSASTLQSDAEVIGKSKSTSVVELKEVTSDSSFLESLESQQKGLDEGADTSAGKKRAESTVNEGQPIAEPLSTGPAEEQPSNAVDKFSHPKRILTFMLPSTAVMKSSKCTETQEILVMEPGGFVYTSTSSTPEVPYGDRFYTRSQFVVTYVSPVESKLRISGEAVWKEKGPPGFPIKGFILNGVKGGHVEAYNSLLALLKEFLAPKRTASRMPKQSKKKKQETSKTPEVSKRPLWVKLLLATLVLLLLVGVSLLAYGVYTGQVDLDQVYAMANEKVRDMRQKCQVLLHEYWPKQEKESPTDTHSDAEQAERNEL